MYRKGVRALNLKFLREKKNISQYRLSKESGISQGLISEYESGQKTPGMKNLLKLSQALGVSVSSLFDSNNPDSAA